MIRSKRRRRRSRRRRKSPETLFWVLLLSVLALGAAGFVAHNILFATEQAAEAEWDQVLTDAVGADDIEAPGWEPREPADHTNILLLGLDNQGMSDLIMILSYHMKTYDSTLISLKRDIFVSGQDWASKDSGQDHLAWAHNRGMGPEKDYHAGARLTAQTVEDLLGIDLHAYATISFDGFTQLVDLIGGVEIEVAPEFALREGGALPTGLQRLEGSQALVYARHRQNPRIPEEGSTSQAGDRVLRNQRLLKAILEQCKTLGTDELLFIVGQLDDKVCTTMEDWDILDMANVLYNRDPGEIETVILPGEGERVYQERIDSEMYYYFLNFEETDIILRELELK